MNTLIPIIPVDDGADSRLIVDSRVVAHWCEIDHESVMRLLNTHKVRMEKAFGPVRFEIGVGSRGGSPRKWALLTENQATVLITFLKNSDPVIEFKITLVEAFSEARAQLAGRKAKELELDLPLAMIDEDEPPQPRKCIPAFFWDAATAGETEDLMSFGQAMRRYAAATGYVPLVEECGAFGRRHTYLVYDLDAVYRKWRSAWKCQSWEMRRVGY